MVEQACHVIISGRVQGVWFRGWTKQQAAKHGLTGWVRNRSDGSVEAIFQGRAEDVQSMLNHCRVGPPMADVVDVDCESISPENFSNFRQLSTI